MELIFRVIKQTVQLDTPRIYACTGEPVECVIQRERSPR